MTDQTRTTVRTAFAAIVMLACAFAAVAVSEDDDAETPDYSIYYNPDDGYLHKYSIDSASLYDSQNYSGNGDILTLDNFTFSTNNTDSSRGALVFQNSVTIVLKGENRITSNYCRGIEADKYGSFADVSISGSGSLEIESANDSICISNGVLTVNGTSGLKLTSSSGRGLVASGITLDKSGPISINSSTTGIDARYSTMTIIDSKLDIRSGQNKICLDIAELVECKNYRIQLENAVGSTTGAIHIGSEVESAVVTGNVTHDSAMKKAKFDAADETYKVDGEAATKLLLVPAVQEAAEPEDDYDYNAYWKEQETLRQYEQTKEAQEASEEADAEKDKAAVVACAAAVVAAAVAALILIIYRRS